MLVNDRRVCIYDPGCLVNNPFFFRDVCCNVLFIAVNQFLDFRKVIFPVFSGNQLTVDFKIFQILRNLVQYSPAFENVYMRLLPFHISHIADGSSFRDLFRIVFFFAQGIRYNRFYFLG